MLNHYASFTLSVLNSDEFQLASCEPEHAEKKCAVAPTTYVCLTVCSITVTNRNVDNFKTHAICAKEEIEVPERIEIPEKRPVSYNAIIILPAKDFCSTECVLHRLRQNPTKCQTEKFVGAKVEKSHGFFFHRVNQPNAIYKFCTT